MPGKTDELAEDASPNAGHGARFDDGKATDAFRTIGEVAQALDIRPHVLRYWEDQFPMLRPVKRAGGRRYYRREDVALVEVINRLVHHEGYTLRGARLKLEEDQRSAKKNPAAKPEAAVPAPPVATQSAAPEAPTGLDAPEIAARLGAIRNGLAQALQD